MIQITDWSHETVFAAEPISASLAREFVGSHLVAHDLLHLVDDVSLVVSELATNAVVHAHTQFMLTLSRHNGSVLLALQDASTSLPVMATPDVSDTGGRGLLLVELLSRAWGTSADGHGLKSVWATFPSQPAPLEPAPPPQQ
jgi:anti-sigma regulatory factor (Ser/Thr protein kinase)